MTTLRHIRGQERAIALLRRALTGGRVPHAYLFCGPAGSGKYTTGIALAMALNCVAEPGEGCGTCGPCDKIATGIHPDVQTLARQGAAQIIPIETIRVQVIPQLGMQPHEGKARVFLIEEANALQGAAANALLKTLEEPPPGTHFILCTTAPEKLLPTIRSRCQRVSFAGLPAVVRAELEGDTGTAEAVMALVEVLDKAASARDLASLTRAAGEGNADKDVLDGALGLLSSRLHERAVEAARQDDLGHAQRLSAQALIVLDTQQAITQNAHGQLTLEAMLHRLRTAV